MELSLVTTPVQDDVLEKAGNNPKVAEEPKLMLDDPMALMDVMGYRRRAGSTVGRVLSYEVLRRMSIRNPIVGAVIQTRQNQVAAFAVPSIDVRDNVGFAILPRDGDGTNPSRAAKKEIDKLTKFIMRTGNSDLLPNGKERDYFGDWLRKTTRDSLTYDQLNTEIVRARNGKPYDFYAADASTLRLLHEAGIEKTETGEPMTYVQVLDDSPVAGFSVSEMVFGIRNPRTDVRSGGYGFSELEMLITTITAHLNAEEFNRKIFEQGATPKGILNIKGNNLPRQGLQGIKRMWLAELTGVMNAWRTPIFNADDVQWIPVNKTNQDMEYNKWLEYLISMTCAIFQIDPIEINFPKHGGSSKEAPFVEASPDAKLKHSKDKGLRPLLRFMMEVVDRKIIEPLNPDFKFMFTGLDARTEADLLALDKDRVETYMTIDEIRVANGFPPLPDGMGKIIKDPTYTQWVLQNTMQEQEQGGEFEEAGFEGEGEADLAEKAFGGFEDADHDNLRVLIQKTKR